MMLFVEAAAAASEASASKSSLGIWPPSRLLPSSTLSRSPDVDSRNSRTSSSTPAGGGRTLSIGGVISSRNSSCVSSSSARGAKEDPARAGAGSVPTPYDPTSWAGGHPKYYPERRIPFCPRHYWCTRERTSTTAASLRLPDPWRVNHVTMPDASTPDTCTDTRNSLLAVSTRQPPTPHPTATKTCAHEEYL